MLTICTAPSPIGPLTIAAHDDRVCLLHFGKDDAGVHKALSRWYPDETVEKDADPAGAATALAAYFSGAIDALDDRPVELNGTRFQRSVWTRLRSVRAGRTATYAEIAKAIGSPEAVRAVGAANGANPIALIVPCHRIIGSNGTLTGYGGGLSNKRWLLQHERALLF
jgi:methylated-DNA-[protein]-cysteine S-methyltransferase